MEKMIVTVEALRRRAKELGIKNAKKYKAEQARIEAIKKEEAVKKEKKQTKTVYKTTIDAPKGDQSKTILQMFKDHPTWSHYKISKIIGCSYTNVHRVWKLWGENKIEDQRKRK